ncbi:MAG: DUF418 domain-containing protein [Saprospiraceae bacterium]
MKPVATSERLQILDALRGFALLGILMVNFMIISWPSLWLDMLDLEHWQGLGNQIAIWLVHFVFENKFFSLFSFLFGIGFSVQWFKAKAEGTEFPAYYLKRQFILLGFGMLHGLLLWPGDFLVLYAVQGMALLLFRNCQTRTLLIWSAVFFLIPILLMASYYFASQSDPAMLAQLQTDFEQQIRPDLLAHIQNSWNLYPNGSLAETAAIRLNDTGRFYASMPFWFWNSFAMFLLGLYVGKRQIFQNLDQHKILIWRVLVMCGLLGLFGNVFFVKTLAEANVYVPNLATLLNALFFPIAIPTMTLFYVALFCTLREAKFFQKILQTLAPMGKIALSNYVMQSLIINVLLFSFGFGLYGQISPVLGLGVCLVIYFFQLWFSHWWTARHQFGPLEWVWRRLTYGKKVLHD